MRYLCLIHSGPLASVLDDKLELALSKLAQITTWCNGSYYADSAALDNASTASNEAGS